MPAIPHHSPFKFGAGSPAVPKRALAQVPSQALPPLQNCPKKASQEAPSDKGRGIRERLKPTNASAAGAAKAGKAKKQNSQNSLLQHPSSQTTTEINTAQAHPSFSSRGLLLYNKGFQSSREGSYIPKSHPLPFKPLARPWRSGHTWSLLATQEETLPFLQLCTSPAPSHGSNSSPLTTLTARGKFPRGSRNLPFQEQLESLPGMHKYGSR